MGWIIRLNNFLQNIILFVFADDGVQRSGLMSTELLTNMEEWSEALASGFSTKT